MPIHDSAFFGTEFCFGLFIRYWRKYLGLKKTVDRFYENVIVVGKRKRTPMARCPFGKTPDECFIRFVASWHCIKKTKERVVYVAFISCISPTKIWQEKKHSLPARRVFMANSKNHSSEVVRISQVAERLGASKSTIRRWVAAGSKFGLGAVFWRISDIDAFLASLSKK